jgi:hypothetical protein
MAGETKKRLVTGDDVAAKEPPANSQADIQLQVSIFPPAIGENMAVCLRRNPRKLQGDKFLSHPAEDKGVHFGFVNVRADGDVIAVGSPENVPKKPLRRLQCFGKYGLSGTVPNGQILNHRIGSLRHDHDLPLLVWGMQTRFRVEFPGVFGPHGIETFRGGNRTPKRQWKEKEFQGKVHVFHLNVRTFLNLSKKEAIAEHRRDAKTYARQRPTPLLQRGKQTS